MDSLAIQNARTKWLLAVKRASVIGDIRLTLIKGGARLEEIRKAREAHDIASRDMSEAYEGYLAARLAVEAKVEAQHACHGVIRQHRLALAELRELPRSCRQMAEVIRLEREIGRLGWQVTYDDGGEAEYEAAE